MFIAEDLTQFKTLFISQLRDMLSPDELGAFILVLANSEQDVFLKNELQDDLKSTFFDLKKKFVSGVLTAPKDDSDVFKQLVDTDLDAFPIWKRRSSGDWEIVYNSMRQLRPARASSQVFESIRQDFNHDGFHFNKPFLKPETLWQGGYQQHSLRVLYNKFPFSNYHLLIAVSPEHHLPQLLTREMNQLNFTLVADAENRLPGFGIGFNSLAAGASVNHLHSQSFIREADFPVEKKCWKHHDGEREYPLHTRFFKDEICSWLYIEQLIAQDVAFNCLYRQSGCYVITRKYQGTVKLPSWLKGAGWLDVAGVMTVSDRVVFESLNNRAITDALAMLKR